MTKGLFLKPLLLYNDETSFFKFELMLVCDNTIGKPYS